MPLPLFSLITCTSDRPEAMELCASYVARFDKPEFRTEWIVVDDGSEPFQFKSSADTYILRHSSPNAIGSFRKNLVTALREVRGEYVCFCEDDDWYSSSWLADCYWALQGNDLYGETAAKYYHVGSRRYQRFHPSSHASLAQTAMRSKHIPWLIERIKKNNRSFHIDFDLWNKLKCRKKLSPKSKRVISIKGMPGKPNIGVGRSMDQRGTLDTDGSVLKKWIGNDAELYESFAVPHEADRAR